MILQGLISEFCQKERADLIMIGSVFLLLIIIMYKEIERKGLQNFICRHYFIYYTR